MRKPGGDGLLEKAACRPRNALDMIIAGVAGANDCVVVTDNEKDFAGLDVTGHLI